MPRKLTRDEYQRLPWMHIYGQPIQHEEAEIRGTVDGLIALRDALTKAIEDGHAVAAAYASDGEGYGVVIQRINVLNLLGPLPYLEEGWPEERHAAWQLPPPEKAP